jgi:hypothetical protein
VHNAVPAAHDGPASPGTVPDLTVILNALQAPSRERSGKGYLLHGG